MPRSSAASNGLVGATFTFKIPRPSSTNSKKRKPQYIPASVKSISVTLNTVNGGAPPPGLTLNPVNVGPTSNGCAADPSNAGNFICTETFDVPPGIDAVTIKTFDGNNGTGNLLSQQNYTAPVVTGQANSYSVVLDANPGGITVSPPGTGVSGSVASGFTIDGTSPVAFTLAVTDTHGSTITGTPPGAPTFSALSANTSIASVSVSNSTLTITPHSTFNTPVQITVTAHPANAGDGLSATSVSFNVTITQTLIAVGGCNGTPQCQINVYTYSGGSFTQVSTISSALGSHDVTYLRFDSANTLYMGDTGTYAILKFPSAAPPTYFGSPTTITDGILNTGLTFGFDVGSSGAMAVDNGGTSEQVVGYAPNTTTHSVAFTATNGGGTSWIGATESNFPTAAVLTNSSGTAFGYAAILTDVNSVANDKIAVVNTSGVETDITSNITSTQGDPQYPNLAWDVADQDLVFVNSGPSFNIVRYHWNGSSFDGGTPAGSVPGNPDHLAVSRDGHIAVSYFCGGNECISVFAHGNINAVSPWNGFTIGPFQPTIHFFPDNSLLVVGASATQNDVCVYPITSTTATGCVPGGATGPSGWLLSDGAISN